MNRAWTIIGVLIVAAVGVAVANVGTGFPSPVTVQPNGDFPDAVRDWLSVAAVVGEGSPTDTLGELSRVHIGFGADDYRHPRLPGALLLQLPLALVPIEWAWTLMNAVAVASAAFLSWAAVRVGRIHALWVPAIGFALLVSTPMLSALLLGSQAPLVAALVAISWLQAERSDTWAAGTWLGVATTLKLFPGILIPMLWIQGRRRAAAGAVAAFGLLNLAGLWLPDVTLVGSLSTLSAFEAPHNLSLGVPVPVVVAVAVLLVLASRWMTVSATFALGSLAMIALSPVVWLHYLTVLLVPLVWALAAGARFLRGPKGLKLLVGRKQST